jgi:hypothetical protein
LIKDFEFVGPRHLQLKQLYDMKQLMHDFLGDNSDGGTVMFSMKNGKGHGINIPFGMGDDSGLAALEKFADGLEKDEIIMELNKE